LRSSRTAERRICRVRPANISFQFIIEGPPI
jgi:hypothetical protein